MDFDLEAPRSVAEALRLVQPRSGTRVAVLAGGTDLLNDLEDERIRADVVVSLRRIPWATLTWKGDRLVVGATLPLRELEADRAVRTRLPGLWQGVRAVGGVALRNRATLGGNLGRASAVSDLLPVLMALDATVHVTGAAGEREVPLTTFVRGSRQIALEPGELIRAVSMPGTAPSEYVWQRVRPANDISQVGVAVARVGTPATWRIALGGASPAPARLTTAEALLTNPEPTELEVELAAQEASRVAPFQTDKRATEAYRRRLVATLVRRAVRSTVEQLRQPAVRKRR